MPTSQVELTISAQNLLHQYIVSKTDPYCVILMKEPWQKNYFEIARTEVILNTHNPQWEKKVIINYNFEKAQKLRFEIRNDVLGGGSSLINDYFHLLGWFETTLSDLVPFSGQQYVGDLQYLWHYDDCGKIIIVTEEVNSSKQIAKIQFRAENLSKLKLLCNNDPFLVISRYNKDDSYSVVTRTEVVPSTQNPVWYPIYIRATKLCNGDFDRRIKIDCYDQRSNGKHKLIGTSYTSLKSLSSTAQNEPALVLINEEKQKTKPNQAAAGVLIVHEIKITEEVTFLDYIRNGTQMHFAVAIDYTASNGKYTEPDSLHYLCADRMNNYELALCGVGEIIQRYDSSQLFPAFGFGAKLPTGEVSHMFHLNGNPSHPYCSSIPEILTHYRTMLNTVQLHGPTNFAPIINNSSSIAEQFQNGRHYFVLLILTDGVISDMEETKRAIINASSLPVSIIIVGVGDAEFDDMDALNSDGVRLSAEGRSAERDIVQFVPLDRFIENDRLSIESQSALATEVLAQIPEQLTSYMKRRGFKPRIHTDNETICHQIHQSCCRLQNLLNAKINT